jgi:hypothetical protein
VDEKVQNDFPFVQSKILPMHLPPDFETGIQNGSEGALQVADVNAALEEMLFTGGSLNAKLLGAADVAFTSVN